VCVRCTQLSKSSLSLCTAHWTGRRRIEFFFLPPDKLIYIYKVNVRSLMPFIVLNGVFCFGTRWKIVLRWEKSICSKFIFGASPFVTGVDRVSCSMHTNRTLTKTRWIIRSKTWNGLGSLRLLVRNRDQKSRYVSGLFIFGDVFVMYLFAQFARVCQIEVKCTFACQIVCGVDTS